MEEEKPEIRRKVDGTYQKGVTGNPGGRPKSSLKDYLRQKFSNMTEEQKEKFIKGIDPIDLFKMAEGNPHNTQENNNTGSVTLEISKSVAEKNGLL